MGFENKKILLFLDVILFIFLVSIFLFTDVTNKISRSLIGLGIISIQSTGSTCQDSYEVQCDNALIRYLDLNQKHYYNFTITQTMSVSLTLRNVTLDNNFNLFAQWAGSCPMHSQLGDTGTNPPQCSAIGPPPLDLCTNTALPPGTYYFAVNHPSWLGLGVNNAPYNISLRCSVIGTTTTTTTTTTSTTSTTTATDTEKPKIETITFNPQRIVILNQIVNISSKITDNVGIASLWMNVTKPNGGKYTVAPKSLGGNIYRFDSIETDVTGKYAFSISVIDTNNNLAIMNDNFYVGKPYKIYLNFKDADNDRIKIEYDLNIHPEGDNLISGEDTLIDENMIGHEYNLIFKKRDITLDLLTDINQDISGDVTIDELSQNALDGISIPDSDVISGYGLSVPFTFVEGLVKLNYSQYDLDENNIRIYKCSDWDLKDRECPSSWKEVTPTFDTKGNTAEITVYSFSAIVLTEYHHPFITRTTTRQPTLPTIVPTFVYTTTRIARTTTTTEEIETTTTTVPEMKEGQSWNLILLVIIIVIIVVVFYWKWLRKDLMFRKLKKKWSKRFR